MKWFGLFLVGIFFGLVMAKSEAVSWFRIQEMFHFQSFHMYGVIGSALAVGVTGTWLIKRYRIKDFSGNPLVFHDKDKSFPRYIIGGTIFGMGWALSGACPGPMVVLIGKGYFSILIVVAGAILGTYLYGLIRDKLPH